MSQHDCFHCGLPLSDADQARPELAPFHVEVGGERKVMCCAGCAAVAQAIVDNGLQDYYRTRGAMPTSPREAPTDLLAQLSLYDHAEFQKTFVRELAEGEREASLLLEGITCAACVWLNEQHLASLKGVLAVDINYATRRARVRWDERLIHLSDILLAVQSIGYIAHPYDASRHEQLARDERRSALWRVWVAGFGMMQVMMYAFPVYVAGEGEMSPEIESLMRWASLLLTLPVVLYSAAPFFQHAWRDLKLKRAGMDVPVALGVGAAFLASVWATLTASGEVYFDSVTMFIFFLLGGRYLEMTARQKAVSVTEALAKLQPSFAERLTDFPASHSVVQCMVGELAVGDLLLVRPGAVIPTDGIVVEGHSHADESLLSGESRPVPKAAGDGLTGGANNVDGPLVMRVTAVGNATRLSSIVSLMERAGLERPRMVDLADRVASRFVAILLVVALLVGLGWYWVDPSQALWITVSVLVVTCPCALSLATPIALTVAAGALARDGVLVTRGHAIETLAQATHFVFDKTGTLTSGQMQLLDMRPSQGESELPRSFLEIAAALEQATEHPIGHALLAACSERSTLPSVQGLQAVAGQGVTGEIDGVRWYLGRPSYVLAHAACPPNDPVGWQGGDTVVALGDGQQVMAWFRLGDTVRPEAQPLVAALKASGRAVTLLTGDAENVAQVVAKQLGIADVRAAATPADKHAYVKSLQAAGAVVAMVGDGVNDAPVLAQAQVSVAMGGGAQLAKTQADIVLLSEDLHHLRRGVERASLAMRVIRQNLAWSFAYNFVALPLAIFGFVTPWLAGIGMSLSSLLVVLNSLRIQRMKDKGWK